MHIHSFKRLLISIIAVATLSGCTTTIGLKSNASADNSKVAVVDAREKMEKKYRRDGALEPIQYFGDSDFDTPPLNHLGSELANILPPGSHIVSVSKFRVIDTFPQRMNTAIAGASAGALSSLGYGTYVSDLTTSSPDSITCIAEGLIDNERFANAATIPYHLSPVAVTIKGDASFISAVNECFVHLARQIAKR